MDCEIIFSIVTSVTALFALFQTQKQIRLSNKQNLFDKRVESYLIADGLIKLYEKNKSLISDKSKLTEAVDYKFILMTNNIFLENIASVINNPLSNQEHKEFLIKLEEIKNIAMKVRLIFDGKPAEHLSDFIDCYGKLLIAMYEYQILYEKMEKRSQECKWTKEKAKKELGEDEYANKLDVAVENLNNSYEQLNNEKITKVIKLK